MSEPERPQLTAAPASSNVPRQPPETQTAVSEARSLGDGPLTPSARFRASESDDGPLTPSRFRVSETVEPLGERGPAALTPRPAAVAEEAGGEGESGGAVASPTARVKMASTVSNALTPTTVLVHGLDSSKDTWTPIVQDLSKAGYPVVALDQRGHGETPVGPVEDYGPEALAADIVAAAAEHGIDRPFVLVGHSMGGRVCMRVAAMDAERVARGLPPLLAALVIEDIDVAVRPLPLPLEADLSDEQRAQLARWEQDGGRRFETLEACEQALLPWYDNDKKRVRSWSHVNASTKIRPCKDGGGFWSDFNPAARRHALRTILHTADGEEAWATLAEQAVREGRQQPEQPPQPRQPEQSEQPERPAAVHCPIELWISSAKGTVCSWDGKGGLNEMIAKFDEAPAGALSHKVYPDSSHCIHRSRRKDYTRDLKAVIHKAAAAAAAAQAAAAAKASGGDGAVPAAAAAAESVAAAATAKTDSVG